MSIFVILGLLVCVKAQEMKERNGIMFRTFTCDTKTCSQEGGERSEVTTSGASLRVYLVNDSVACNHSNQVSWTKVMTKIQDFCPCRHGSECVSAGVSVCLLMTVLFSIGLIIMVSAIIAVHVMEKLKRKNKQRVLHHQHTSHTL